MRLRLLPLALAPFLLVAADWPHWRGPTRDGHTPEPSGFAAGKWLPDKPAWTAHVGAGASSPLIVGDRVYTLGHVDGRDVLRCLDAGTGQEHWTVPHKGP